MSEPPVVLFDGECALCNASVRWLQARSQAGALRYEPLASATARELLERAGAGALAEPPFDTLVLVEHDRVWTRSDAALRACARLRFPWSALAMLRGVPRPVRDAVYGAIARRRHALACRLPGR